MSPSLTKLNYSNSSHRGPFGEVCSRLVRINILSGAGPGARGTGQIRGGRTLQEGGLGLRPAPRTRPGKVRKCVNINNSHPSNFLCRICEKKIHSCLWHCDRQSLISIKNYLICDYFLFCSTFLHVTTLTALCKTFGLHKKHETIQRLLVYICWW